MKRLFRVSVLGGWAGFVLAVVATMGLGSYAFAQLTTGDIVGTVTDESGAAISGATIDAINDATGVKVEVRSSSSGEFHITSLPAGSYTVVGSAPGFAAFSLRGFEVQLNNTATAKLVLPVGKASTSVQVSAEAAAVIDTTTVQLQSTFSEKELEDLPISTVGNGVLNLSLLTPGVSSSGAVGAGTGPSVGGQRPRADDYTIEGIDNNDKSVTGPLVYVPNDAVGEFTAITNQFSPEFGHSAGGQFNTVVRSGSNALHGRVYEYFDNRDLNAENAIQGGKIPNPRYDFNRYGGEAGGPIKRDKLFYFGNFERQTTGQSGQLFACTPTAAGMSTLGTIPNLSATNLGIFTKYTPVSPSQVNAANDLACFNDVDPAISPNGEQYLTVFDGDSPETSYGPGPSGEFGGTEWGSGTAYNIPLGNYLIKAPNYSNFYALTTAGDWTISPEDTFRVRYLYNRFTGIDTAAELPAFYQPIPDRYQLIAASEYHNFTPNLVNEARLGYNRFYNETPSGNFSFPGLDSFPTMYMYDVGFIEIGPDGNAPQSTIQNLYQLTDNVSWTKGKHSFKFGFDGRKYISPQSFTQRVRGDYEWNYLTEYLHDVAPTAFGERSTGNFFYYGDQTAFYGYGNDVWRLTPKVSLNYGVRYEFTSVPEGEKVQALNSAASVPGLITFAQPTPQKTNFLPRIGIDYAPEPNTAIRAGFGMAEDVLYDNLGILSFPPQFSSTNDVGEGSNPNPGDPNFLANGGLPAGTGTLATFASIADQRAATSAFVPNQVLPYAETWSLGVQHVFDKDYTAEVRYLGTRGIHLPTQNQLNVQDKVDATHNLPTYLTAPSANDLAGLTNTLASIEAQPNIVPAFASAGFTSKITTYQPWSESNYNGLAVSLNRRFTKGFLVDGAYTWSKTMDDATADVFSTVLTPRRPQNKRDVAADYSLSALDHRNRLSLYAVYDVPVFHGSSNWIKKNLVGNWEVAPIYIYESPEYYTVLSGVNSVLDGDSTQIDRTVWNSKGTPGTGSGVTALYDANRASQCTSGTQCNANLVAYLATNPNARYIEAAPGALPTSARNTEPIRPIDDLDATAIKRFNFTERYNLEFSAQAFNVLNHSQNLPGTLDNINSPGYTSQSSFQTVTNPSFNQPAKFFAANARSMQLSLKFSF